MPVAKPKLKKPKAAAGAGPNAAVAAGSFDFSPQGIMAQYQQAYNAANAANLGRYGDILQGYTDRYDRNMGSLNKMSLQRQSDINENYNSQAANTKQRLTDLGMSGTTVAPTMAAGVERNRIADQNRLADQVLQQRVGMDAGLSGDRLQFMERRTDELPDLGLYAQLAMQAAAGGIGGGQGGPGGGGGFPGGGAGAPGAGPAALQWGMVDEYKTGPDGPLGGKGYLSQRPLSGVEKQSLMKGFAPSGYNGPSYPQMLAASGGGQKARSGGIGSPMPAPNLPTYQKAPALGATPTMAANPVAPMTRSRGLYGALASRRY